MKFTELVENFDACSDWEERYSYLISLGTQLAPFPLALKTEATRVPGCLSQVWMYLRWDDQGKLILQADSDAAIVKGLIAVLIALFSERTRSEIEQVDVEGAFARLGLDQHLSPNRRNGFLAMVERVKKPMT